MLPQPAALEPPPLPLPLLGRLVPAGFPSPADDYLDGEIDLNRFLIERPAACYLMRVSGPSMAGAGILDGDLADRGAGLDQAEEGATFVEVELAVGPGQEAPPRCKPLQRLGIRTSR